MRNEITVKNCLLFIVLSIITSCSNNHYDWEEINATGIEGQNISVDYLFIHGNNAVLLGNNSTDDVLINKKFDNVDAVVYFSNDICHSWLRQQIGNGTFTAAANKNRLLCAAINLQQFGEDSALNKDATTIYFSNDYGHSWSVISSFAKMYVRNIFLLSETEMYLIGKKTGNGSWNLIHTIDKGINWETVQIFSNIMSSPLIFHDRIFYISENNIEAFSLKDKSIVRIKKSDENLDVYVINCDNEALLISGINKKSKNIQVENFNSSTNQFNSLVEIQENKFPINVHLSKDGELILLLGKLTTWAVNYSLYFTEKVEKNGHIIPVPSLSIAPFAYDNGDQFYVYTYSGMFYRFSKPN